MKENRLKLEAVRKANSIIELLHEEIQELNGKIYELERMLSDKERVIEGL